MKIFISYRRKDSGREIGRIRDHLMAEFGAQSVFRDLVDIPAGADFRTVLDKETHECDVMLVLIGPLWSSITDMQGNKRIFDPSDFTRIEVETGLQRLTENKTVVIPVLVMNAMMPAASDLPKSLERLTFQNAISIRDDPDFDHDMKHLICDIRRSRGFTFEEVSLEIFEPETTYIIEGPFQMGSPPSEGISPYETPRYEIYLPAYRIGKFPVTNGQYQEFISQTKTLVSPFLGWDGQKYPEGLENYPVTGVTWYEALAYCQWLSERTGRKYSLPNEAQWEKACRGGGNNIYPWGDEFDTERCNFGRPKIAPVDCYPPQNDFGCFDFVGNVYQWTCSLWGKKRFPPDSQYSYPWKSDRRNDLNANGEIRRVVRGSTMSQNILAHRCSARNGQVPEDRGFSGARYGFRVVRI